MTDDRSRMIFGLCLLITLAVLAGLIAVAVVEERHSYRLMPLMTTLATLAGGFTQWAFSRSRNSERRRQLMKDKEGEHNGDESWICRSPTSPRRDVTDLRTLPSSSPPSRPCATANESC